MSNMGHELTLRRPGQLLHRVTLQLRCESEVGFIMVKWIAAIEFVHDFSV